MRKDEINIAYSVKTAAAAALLLAAAACGEAPEARRADATPVTLSVAAAPMAGAGNATRAAEAGVLHRERTFAAGEQIYAYFPEGVNVGSAVYTTVDAAAGSTNATSTDNKPLPTLTQAGGSLAMYAYWPASVTERTATWTVAQNQSAAAAYNASDLMTATGTIQADGQCTNASIGGSQATALTLQHQMARIVVSLTSNSSARMTRLELISGYRTTGLTMPAGTPGGSLTDAVTPAEPLTISSTSATLSATATKFCCLVPPQGFAANEPLLRITTDRGTVTCHTLRAQPLQAGHEYTLTADVTDVTATAAIAAWTQQPVTPGESDEDLYAVNGVKFRMIPVEPGTSGSNTYAGPQYYMGQTEVTSELWAKVSSAASTETAQTPATSITKTAIQAWIAGLNTQTQTQRPAGYVFALPTREQFVYAFRGGRYSRGFTYSGSDGADAVAWYTDNLTSVTDENKKQPVMLKKPNELGLYDMSGNASEMVQEVDASNNVLAMGGNWNSDATLGYLKGTEASTSDTDGAYNNWGFRLALVREGSLFGCTKAEQTFTAEAGKTYHIECWGAQGGGPTTEIATLKAAGYILPTGGRGAYVSGYFTPTATTTLQIYVGEQPTTTGTAGWNGGGAGTQASYDYGGGGATDVRIDGTRIMIAAGGGGTTLYAYKEASTIQDVQGGWGGALGGSGSAGGSALQDKNSVANAAALNAEANGNAAGDTPAGGATQSGGGTGYVLARYTTLSNGQGANGSDGAQYQGGNGGTSWGCGGGGGYFGGGGGGWSYLVVGCGGGGSSWADTSKLTGLTSAAGNQEMPNPRNGRTETGHRGSGYVVITPVE